MSDLFSRLSRRFATNAGVGLAGLHDDTPFAPERPRPAAVLVAITERPQPGLILTRRPDTMSAHPGQVAFPGGKIEAGENAIAAALREAQEELALDPALVRVVGEAASFVTGSGYLVTPVLATIPPDLPLVADPREVACWFEAPLRHVLDRANHAARVGLFRGVERPYTEIMWGDHRIWGITAGIVAHLSHRLDGWDEAA